MTQLGHRKLIVIFIVAGVAASLLLAMSLRDHVPVDENLQRVSDQFIARFTELVETLEPGERTTVSFTIDGEYDLVFLRAYCRLERLEECLPERSAGLARELHSYAQADGRCPALVWIENGRAKLFHPAVELWQVAYRTECWSVVDGRLDLTVAKQSGHIDPNVILMLYFLDGEAKHLETSEVDGAKGTPVVSPDVEEDKQ